MLRVYAAVHDWEENGPTVYYLSSEPSVKWATDFKNVSHAGMNSANVSRFLLLQTVRPLQRQINVFF